MAQDEHFVTSSNSAGSGGGGAAAGAAAATAVGGGASNNKSKTPKQKKIPQRGLGVAQLEKLRMEEQRKKEALQAANALANSAAGPGNDSLQGPKNLPAPAPSPAGFLPPNALYRSLSPMGPAQITKQSSDCGGEETGLEGVCNWPRLWSGEYNSSSLDGGIMEKQRVIVDHAGFAFGVPQVNVNLQFDPGSVLPFPSSGPQRLYQFQRPPPPPMVNVSSGISPSPVSSSRIEPPSIQNVCGSNYKATSWPEDDKIVVGIKRSYPFSLEGPSTPSFLGSNNFHPTYGVSISGSDELASSSNEPRNKFTRDGASNSTLSEQNPSEDMRVMGDFLSLAPPVASYSLPPSNSKNKHHPIDFMGHHQVPDLSSDNKSLSSQENLKSSQSHQPGSSSSKEQAFSFFPIKSQTEHSRNGNRDKGEKLDLNLKL
ncbi:DNAse I-like superfamily protein [Striga asiatica]|uniref:DNAse I-like superfamily protein n=1 Tax=Striga asiatica TaxID=4170 RepID=A0A5A7R8D5_STRAF|nr:DNAse I-like superfamily protein [Striga asiatica]